MKKVRIDQLLVSRGLAPSRERAKAYVMERSVLADNELVIKAGELVSPDASIVLKNKLQYVSRGGLKLEKMIKKHSIDLTGDICLDIGASTGGFTDCMLQNGAQKVYAVDVGYGQLAWKLRNDARVVVLERTNARYLTEKQIPQGIDFASVDVSFISLTLILPVLEQLLAPKGRAVTLIKPQFEAGKEKVGKKGVVKDFTVHREVLQKIYNFCKDLGISIKDMEFSPIKGPEGNIEYLFYLQKGDRESVPLLNIDRLIKDTQTAFSK